MSSREAILSRVKEAVATPSPWRDETRGLDAHLNQQIQASLPASREELLQRFQDELTLVSAHYHQCPDVKGAAEKAAELFQEFKTDTLATAGRELLGNVWAEIEKVSPDMVRIEAADLPWPQRKAELAEIKTALVEAPWAVASTGSLVFPYGWTGTSMPHFLADNLIVLVRPDHVMPDLPDVLAQLSPDEARDMVLVSGPSRTADIEKVLILGAHGPRRVDVIVVKRSVEK